VGNYPEKTINLPQQKSMSTPQCVKKQRQMAKI